MSFEAALASFSKAGIQYKKDLEEREKALARERTAFEAEKQTFGAGKGKASDVLRLNVGGKSRVDILRRTLTMVEGSLLASQFSGRWDDSLEKDCDGNFFVDQAADLFEPVIDFLRQRAMEIPGFPCADPPGLNMSFGDNIFRWRDFLRMLEYYNITHGIYRLEIQQVKGVENNETLRESPVFFYPSVKVESETLSAFQLILFAHTRSVKSFEVRVNRHVTEFCVGWGAPRKATEVATYDPLKESVLFNFVLFEKLNHGKATVLSRNGFDIDDADAVCIKSDNRTKQFWLNGKELFGFRDSEYSEHHYYHWVPTISCIGTFYITKVEYLE